VILYRTAPDGSYAVALAPGEPARLLSSDPFETAPSHWELGPPVDLEETRLLAPVRPSKIVGIGRNYKDHAAELGNPMPEEPLVFLKAPSSLVGPGEEIVLHPESSRIEFEGEIAAVVRHRLTRASRDEARAGLLGVTAANDVTARDLQRKDATFARGKGIDTFCPVGPGIWVEPDMESLEVVTRVNGEERQRGHTGQMEWGVVDLLVYVSRFMTLEPGDLVLTGTPSGVGPLAPGDRVEVEIPGLGVLDNQVVATASAAAPAMEEAR
jgi:2-keto-4-pentenoate hydratase/2-oxohepta-3-ene-1,7-dioic acid hydratase in catechol pathway